MERLWKAAGAAAWGAAALGGLQPFLSPQGAAAIQALCPGARTVPVAALHYAGAAPGNLSLYCRGEDYHRVLHRRLAPVCPGPGPAPPRPRLRPGGGQFPGARAGRGGAGGGGVPGPPRPADCAPLWVLRVPGHRPHRPGPALHRAQGGDPLSPKLPGLPAGLPHRGPGGGGVRRDPLPVPLVPGEGGPAPGDGPGPSGQPHRLGV